MIEILLGILTLIGIATLFLLTQNKSNNSDVKFQISLDEKMYSSTGSEGCLLAVLLDSYISRIHQNELK